MLFRFNRYAVVGFIFLALALSGALLLLTSFLVGVPSAVVTTVIAAVVFFDLWLVSPLLRRRADEAHAPSRDGR